VSCGGDTAAEGVSNDSGISAICSSRNGVARGASCVCCNGGSVITTQRAFRFRFELGRHDPVPVRKTIHFWVSNFRATGSALKKKSPGRPRTVTTPEVVARESVHPAISTAFST
jgi:hypothetical protein